MAGHRGRSETKCIIAVVTPTSRQEWWEDRGHRPGVRRWLFRRRRPGRL